MSTPSKHTRSPQLPSISQNHLLQFAMIVATRSQVIILINVYLIKLLSAVNQWQEPFHPLHKQQDQK